jgi:hypothetical protein
MGSRVETRRFQAMGKLDSYLYSPPPSVGGGWNSNGLGVAAQVVNVKGKL